MDRLGIDFLELFILLLLGIYLLIQRYKTALTMQKCTDIPACHYSPNGNDEHVARCRHSL
jgi:hypothetical protein